MLHETGDSSIELAGRNYIAHEPEGKRFVRVDLLSRVDQISGGLARQPVHQRGHRDGRHDAVRHLRQLKAGSVACDGDVTERGQSTTQADGPALNHADDGYFSVAKRAVEIENRFAPFANAISLENRAGLAHRLATETEIVPCAFE